MPAIAKPVRAIPAPVCCAWMMPSSQQDWALPVMVLGFQARLSRCRSGCLASCCAFYNRCCFAANFGVKGKSLTRCCHQPNAILMGRIKKHQRPNNCSPFHRHDPHAFHFQRRGVPDGGRCARRIGQQGCEGQRLQGFSCFFDWIADEATALVELNVAQSFHNGKFVQSLRAGDPRIALSLWVGRWVAPKIAMRFAHLAPHLPMFSVASVADAQPVAHEHVKTFWHDWRPIQLLALPPWGVSQVACVAQAGHR